MRAAVVTVCLAASSAYAQPSYTQPSTDEVAATPTPLEAPTLAVEIAGTWSGNSVEPKNGWRAAILHTIATAQRPGNITYVSVIARYDNHGAPAESGVAETMATSWGGGLRATTTWGFSSFRLGVFGEGTLGITRARYADEMTSQRDEHMMASGGIVAGTKSLQLVADFGWLVTDVGDGRIGPIASLGLNVALD
jgi:hypothetical protein